MEGFGIDPAQIHASLQQLRNRRWAGHAAVTSLCETLSSALDAFAPGVPLLDLARALAKARTDGSPSDDDVRTAAALVRVALELRPNPLATWRRIGTLLPCFTPQECANYLQNAGYAST